jgi:hypothetical protein
MLYEHAGVTKVPDTIAEIGPGKSLGVGMAALLSGANQYYALDVIRHAGETCNLRVFDELVALFENRTSRPKPGWPDYSQHLDENLFPRHILSKSACEKNLAPERVSQLRSALKALDGSSSIRYIVPWVSPDVIEAESVDFAFSTSVLAHVVDLRATYLAFYQWLKPGGLMSHQIDFRSHGLTPAWNGYRACSEFVWKLVCGKRPYLINREPLATHIQLMEEAGFEIVLQLKKFREDGINRAQLSNRWKNISDDDLNCAQAFVQARKPR